MKKALLGTSAIVVIASLGVAIACGDGTTAVDKSTLAYGPTVSFGQGSARAWVQTDASGTASSIGIAFTETALNGLPTTVSGPSPTALMATLPLPAEAAGTGFDHAELGYNPLGHDPVQIYGLPHFDMHFYTISAATQLAILPNDPQWATKASNLPATTFVPSGYVAPPAPIAASAIPQMGVHWSDVKSPEFNGQTFSSTFIYGSWDGQFIFMEPMITKAYLESHPSNATRNIPQPAQWAKAGSYPTSYTVNYDATAKEYRIALGGLTKH
ncbi:MAG: DUF5602 domain-containing protein [Gemmatimonadaceae bacterium]